MKDFSGLRSKHDQFSAIQKLRIQAGQRAWAIEEGTDTGTQDQIDRWKTWEGTFVDLEGIALDELKEEASYHPAYEPLQWFVGIGPALAAALLGAVGDFARYETVSKWCKHAGYSPGQRRQKGYDVKADYRMKGILGRIGMQLLRTVNGPFRPIYDKRRAYYELNRDWTDGHCHLAALRKMIVIFMAMAWEVGRKAQGLPIREPYPLEHPTKHPITGEWVTHSTRYNPAEFMKVPKGGKGLAKELELD